MGKRELLVYRKFPITVRADCCCMPRHWGRGGDKSVRGCQDAKLWSEWTVGTIGTITWLTFLQVALRIEMYELGLCTSKNCSNLSFFFACLSFYISIFQVQYFFKLYVQGKGLKVKINYCFPDAVLQSWSGKRSVAEGGDQAGSWNCKASGGAGRTWGEACSGGIYAWYELRNP